MDTYMPGTRVRVFDWRPFVDDRKTPLAVTIQLATVLRWYGALPKRVAGIKSPRCPSMIDVRFDRDGKDSCGHFAEPAYVERIAE